MKSEIMAKHTDSLVQTFGFICNRKKIIGCTYSKRKDPGEKTLGVGNKERKPGSMASQIVLNWMMKNSL